MGRPSICEEVKYRIFRVITEFRAKNDSLLPAERELAVQLGVSRGTIRKVLDEMEQAGIIRRENQTTRILPPKKQIGRYAFCAASNLRRQCFAFGLYQRLWEVLQHRSNDFSLDLVLVPHQADRCAPEILEQLRQYDLIFVSYILPPVVGSMKAAALPLIMLDEQNADPAYPLICLDNREAGRIAAANLLKASCRKALTIEYCIGGNYRPFDLRREGFTEVFERGGGSVASIGNPHEIDNPLDCIKSIAEAMKPYLTNGTDAVFYLSDESMPMLNWYWYHSRPGLGDVRLSAFRGSGNPITRDCGVSFLDMDHDGMISAMLCMIEHFEKTGKFPPLCEQRIPPVLSTQNSH